MRAGEPAAGGVVEAAALQGEVPMVTTVGPAVGDLSGVVNSDVAAAPVASADVEVLIVAHTTNDVLFCLPERCCIAAAIRSTVAYRQIRVRTIPIAEMLERHAGVLYPNVL